MRQVIKTHQIEGISFMLRNITAGRGCILAHSMGKNKNQCGSVVILTKFDKINSSVSAISGFDVTHDDSL